jgi:hypothetical protein
VWFLQEPEQEQEPHGVTSQNTSFFIVTALKISNLTDFSPAYDITTITTLGTTYHQTVQAPSLSPSLFLALFF